MEIVYVTYIRSSSYNNYDFCQQQYFINYVLGYPSGSSKKAEMGTIVHKVMECLARSKKAVQDNKKSYKDDSLGRIRITKDKMLSSKYVDSLIDKSYEHYVSESVHKYAPRDYKDCVKWSHAALEFNQGQFDPRNRNVVAPEPHFDIEIKEPWAKYDYTMPDGSEASGHLAIKGTIDLVTEVSDGVMEAVDWKTGRRIDWATGQEKDYDKLSKDPQLLLYHYALSHLFPNYEQTIMTIFYIRDGGPFSLCFDESDNKLFLDMLKNRFEEIKNNQSPELLSEDHKHWKCTKLCHYYKNNWQGTNQRMCSHVKDKINKDGINQTVDECTKEGFTLGYYSAPG